MSTLIWKCTTTLLKKNFQICPTSGLSHLLQIWFNDAIRLDCIEWICTPYLEGCMLNHDSIGFHPQNQRACRTLPQTTKVQTKNIFHFYCTWHVEDKSTLPNENEKPPQHLQTDTQSPIPWKLEGWTPHLQEETQSQHPLPTPISGPGRLKVFFQDCCRNWKMVSRSSRL